METFDDVSLNIALDRTVERGAHRRDPWRYPVDADALHVSATDLSLVSRGSLANLDPFVVADIGVREAIVGGHCGCRLSLGLTGDRVREWADAD